MQHIIGSVAADSPHRIGPVSNEPSPAESLARLGVKYSSASSISDGDSSDSDSDIHSGYK